MGQFKILIIDDEYGIVFMVERIYKKKGFIVFGANDGIKAVEVFEKERPNLTFIDIHMPYSPIDGIETLERIKKIDKDANCVMLTRIYDNTSISRTKALGAMHYITKPFEIEDLDKCINEVQAKIPTEGG
ncbi:MAG: response regulator [Candidatus Omnitrophota bacterium]|nr:response regulator [Candidatus Omnitrophota bacterium]